MFGGGKSGGGGGFGSMFGGGKGGGIGSMFGGQGSGGVEHGEMTTCDMRYRDTEVTCLEVEDLANDVVAGTRLPSCPPKPMPMIETPLLSPISHLSPYLYEYPRDEKEPVKAYNGPFASGTAGGPESVFSMVAQPAGDTQKISSCAPQIQFPTHSSNPEVEARKIRLQLDNCANQYILFNAPFPNQKENSKLYNDPSASADFISLKTECQPLRTFEEMDNEYKAGEYLEVAFKKLLNKASYVKNRSAHTEPRMPKGLKLENPIDVLPELKEVRLSQIAALPYEEILDPSHPYSPRWDFSFNERERYSPMTSEYMKDTENQVYCAGVREADNNNKDVSEEDQMVKVDVLSFRKKKFQPGILKRIAYNTACIKDQGTETASFFKNLATSYCHKPKWLTFVPCIVGSCNPQSKRVECWDCFKLDGKLAKDKQPPCSTHYDEKDLKIKGFNKQPALFNGMAKTASCNPPPFFFRQKKHRIDKLCRDLRAPVTMINKLKMRYHNPDDKEYAAMRDGVPEGYTFREYFGNHMPYPRLWDTGSSIQTNTATDNNDQPPEDVMGQWTALVGVGREGAIAKSGEEAMKKHPDERCKIGGWGGSQGYQEQDFGKGMDGGMGSFSDVFGGMKTGDAGAGFDFGNFFGGMKGMPGFDSFANGGFGGIGGGKGGGGMGSMMGGMGGMGGGGGGGMGSMMGGMGGGGGGGMGGMMGGMGGGSGIGSGAGGGFNFNNMDFGGIGDNALGGMGNMGGMFDGMIDNMTGPSIKVDKYKIRIPDPITSWTELKLYQARTMRNINISCIGRYEKVFKSGSTEGMVMQLAGGEWSQLSLKECPRDGGPCKQISLDEFRNQGGTTGSNSYRLPETITQGFPLAWRGYISSGESAGGAKETQFPNFGGQTANLITGLDNAQLGDIILMPNGATNTSGGKRPGLAKIALVAEVNLPRTGNCKSRDDCFVRVLEADNGKWPDACGGTDAFGELRSRYYFKTMNDDHPAKQEYDRIRATPSCEDTKLGQCLFEPWNSVQLYRIRTDVRKGCDKANTSECKE